MEREQEYGWRMWFRWVFALAFIAAFVFVIEEKTTLTVISVAVAIVAWFMLPRGYVRSLKARS